MNSSFTAEVFDFLLARAAVPYSRAELNTLLIPGKLPKLAMRINSYNPNILYVVLNGRDICIARKEQAHASYAFLEEHFLPAQQYSTEY